MIRIYLGNLGSGKTLSTVVDMLYDQSGRKTYTNLLTKGIKNVYTIKPQDVISKNVNDKGKVKLDLNVDFWQKQKKPLNLIWDEIHLSMGNSRRSMSSANLVFSKFIAMGRRITGFNERGYGHLIFVAQKERTLDTNLKELCNEIHYHIAHWYVACENCLSNVWTSSEKKQIEQCPVCGGWNITRKGLYIEKIEFDNWNDYYKFQEGLKCKKKRYLIQNADEYFKYYDTMQFEGMWEKYLEDT